MSTNEHTTKLRTLLLEDEVQYIKYINNLPDKIMDILRLAKNTDLVVNEFVAAVQEYVISNILSIMDIETIEESDEGTIEIIQSIVSQILIKYLTSFFVENIRRSVVEYHAQGCTTTEAINTMIEENPAMRRLALEDAIGIKKIRRALVQRLAHLKPGHPRWPEQKYGEIWRDARRRKIELTTNLPLTNTAEQISVLVDNVKQMQSALEKEDITARDIYLITNSITKTIQTLNKITMSENSKESIQQGIS